MDIRIIAITSGITGFVLGVATMWWFYKQHISNSANKLIQDAKNRDDNNNQTQNKIIKKQQQHKTTTKQQDQQSGGDNDDDDDDNSADSDDYSRGEYKMVLVVNESLKMGKGKIAAQCCHACLGSYKKASIQDKKAWSRTGQAKVTLKIPTTEELLVIDSAAEAIGLPHYLVADAGRTQIAAGSLTVLGIGPARIHEIDQITKHLKLL
jgi:PTH2 family peptidyl-tRNA hydrolase